MAIFTPRSDERIYVGALAIISCVDLVVGRHVGGCKKRMTWRQAASCMSRLVGLINSNCAKSQF